MVQSIGIWTQTLEHLTYTISRVCALGDAKNYVFTAKKDLIEYRGHKFYYEKIENFSNVKFLDQCDEVELDWLYIQLSFISSMSDLLKCAKQDKHVCIFSSSKKFTYLKTLFYKLKEIVKYAPVTLRAEKVFLPNGFYKLDIYGIWYKKYYLGFDVHSNFLDDIALFNKLFDSS
ncbi:MAG TPA: hypothetical protein V6D10_15520 [Trichocoleus sp.]|jgi:hypothetical protein